MTAIPTSLSASLPLGRIETFCQRWSISRVEVFGTALRANFRSHSDLDLLATYEPSFHWSLLDRVRMKLELEATLGRKVDFLNRRALERQQSRQGAARILAEAQTVYAGA